MKALTPPCAVEVIKEYRSAYPSPVFLTHGALIELRPHSESYPGWSWARTADGLERWFPDEYLSKDGTTARLIRDYDSTELTVKVGELLTGLDQSSGWVWCERTNGARGWLPLDHLKAL